MALVAIGATLCGQEFFPLEEVRAGQRGKARTVFAGTQVEEFDVEILGVLKNFTGPKRSAIFGRLSGGPLSRTGVLAGMSGSPVYIDGRLAGAVAFAFPFSQEPLAGIRPIEDMVSGYDASATVAGTVAVDPLRAWRQRAGLPVATSARPDRAGRFAPIATPVALSGFSERVADVFREDFRRLGLRPVQGAGGAAAEAIEGPLRPGAMISVGLIRGDMNLAASGTVTHVEGDRLFAFGHRFLSAGTTSMPMMRASVMAVVPNLSSSFKLSTTGPVIGTVALDRDSGIVGELGPGPSMVPCSLKVRPAGGPAVHYSIELVRDHQLTPLLLQIALFSAVDGIQRAIGPLTVTVRGGVSFRNGLPSLVLDDIYAGNAGVAQAAALSSAAPLSYLLQIGHPGVEIDSIDLELESEPALQRTDLVRAWVSKQQVRPGETVQIRFAVKGPDGSEELRHAEYTVPASMPAGAVDVTLGDALTANMQRWRGLFAGRKARDAAATIGFLNGLRGSDQAYLRIWQRRRSLWLRAERLHTPPASVRAVLSTTGGRAAGALDDMTDTMEEIRIGGFTGVVQGRLSLRFVVTDG